MKELDARYLTCNFLAKATGLNTIPIALLLISLFVTVVACAKVFQIVRRHRRQIHERFKLSAHFHGRRSAVEIARHEKAALTILYILVAFAFLI